MNEENTMNEAAAEMQAERDAEEIETIKLQEEEAKEKEYGNQ